MIGKQTYIRPFETKDGDFLAKWFFSGEYPIFFRHSPFVKWSDFSKWESITNNLIYIIFPIGCVEPIGMIIIYLFMQKAQNCKLGIMLDKDNQKKGIAIESVYLISKYLFREFNLHKIFFESVEDDERTNHILNEAKFIKEATINDAAKIDGKFKNEIIWSITHDNFEKYYGGGI